MNQDINLFVSFWVDWFDCIRSPLKSCRKILISAIPDKEKIIFASRIWIIAFLLSFALELPLYFYIGIHIEKPFVFSYLAYGFLLIFIASFIMHIVLRAFGIQSIFHETFIIYSILMGSYSPFLLLLSYPVQINNALLITEIKNGHIPSLNALPLLFYNKINYEPLIVIVSSFMNILSGMLNLIIVVLLLYAIMDRYNSNKFRTLLSITFFQIFLLPYLFPFMIKDVILLFYKG
jgi:hypothetical protein